MAIVRITNPEETPTQEEATIPDHVSSCVTQDEHEVKSLINYIGGQPWSVEYYRQILGADDPAQQHDSNYSPTIQHYELIHNLVFRVIDPIGGGSTDTNNVSVLEGSSVYIAEVPPNPGDMFTVELLGNRPALFTVTSVTRRSYNLSSLYVIDYTLVLFTDNTAGANELASLNEKVLREFYYSDESKKTIPGTELDCIKDLYVIKKGLMDWYMRLFIERESNTLLLPKQENGRYFDNYIAEYIVGTNNVMEIPEIANINLLENNHDHCMRRPTIWTALKYHDIRMLYHCDSIMGQLSVGRLQGYRYTNMMRYGWVDYIIYPIENNPTLAYDNTCLEAEPLALNEVSSYGRDLSHLFQSPTDPRHIPLVTEDEFYVFRKEFYTGNGELTLFEQLTRDFISTGKCDSEKLLMVAQRYRDWGLLEQFYYIPILFTLIKGQLR